MTRQTYFLLFLLGFGIVSLAAIFQKSPGYMDADYYLMGGLQLVEGKGFTEPILWNYLDEPIGLPHPSHGYWMPLPSILAAISMKLTSFYKFAGARISFLILAGCVPIASAWLTWRLLSERAERIRRNMAILSGVLATFPGYYLAFFTVPDAFAVYMLLGTIILGVVGSDWALKNRGVMEWGKWLGVGIIAGLMHLARADGFLWLGVIGIGLIMKYGIRNKYWILGIGFCIVGYLFIMGPWMLRNLKVLGTPLAPGGARALWMLNYDELFSFPVTNLTFERWWASGLNNILQARIWALGQNLQTTLGVQGMIFLLPLIIIGIWHLRRNHIVKIGLLAWGLTLVLMTVVFPFSGARGGFFHSGAAIQPLFWAVVPTGLEMVAEWGHRIRGWRVVQAQSVFGVGLVGLAVVVTVLIFDSRVEQETEGVNYMEVEKRLLALGAMPGEIVMVNNPPGYFLASGRPAVVVPDGGVTQIEKVAGQYFVRYVVLDANVPVGLQPLIKNPTSVEKMVYLENFQGYLIYEVKP